MAKFSVPDPNDHEVPVKPAMDEVRLMNSLPPTPKPAIPNPNVVQPPSSIAIPPPPIAMTPQVDPTDLGPTLMSQQTLQAQSMATTAQAQATVGLAQTAIDQQIINEQTSKEEEHWVKAYWRPAMGWLYMGICFCDFIFFPLLTMFLPVIEKGFGVTMGYTAWQSLSLSNGGLIHLAFGTILGVSAWTRGQEKLAKIN